MRASGRLKVLKGLKGLKDFFSAYARAREKRPNFSTFFSAIKTPKTKKTSYKDVRVSQRYFNTQKQKFSKFPKKANCEEKQKTLKNAF